MDHVVYTDAKADELTKILDGIKTMIIRGAAGRKMPYGRVDPGDWLYLIENDGSGLVKARTRVKTVLNSPKMAADESIALVNQHQGQLQLTPAQHKRWAGKRYLVLIEIQEIEEVASFGIDKSRYGNMDDWLPVGKIETVRLGG